MIGAISRKVCSQHGASMLLALLFLLICSMVTASILMAAVTNAGKHRSNLEEHQVYLSLSSAVSTLCDELNRSEYQGKYKYWETTDTKTDPATGEAVTETLRHFTQLEGTYPHISPAAGDGYLKEILLENFDGLFAQEINGKLASVDYDTFDLKPEHTDMKHILTLAPEPGSELDDTPVHITLEIKDSYAIYITAYLEGLETYQVEAELTPKESKPTVSTPPAIGTHSTQAMRWALGWITILDKEGGGSAGS